VANPELHLRRVESTVLSHLTGVTRSMDPISNTVNGHTHSVEVAPDTRLLWVPRATLGFTGTKFGCGQALCGARTDAGTPR
jgi:xanthine dehydrogenase iron-sulfur cluster and FAD-binding subunit A